MYRNLRCFVTPDVRCAITIKKVTYPQYSNNIFNALQTNNANFHSQNYLRFWEATPLCQKLKPPTTQSQLVESKEQTFSELSLEQKVKQTGKDATYTGVIIFGFALTGFMFYTIGKELFSGQSPNGLYNKAHKLCLKNERVNDALGNPIKAYGEANSRGRRRYVRFNEFIEDGLRVMNIQFYLEGPQDKGRVFAEARQDIKGKYHLTRIVLQLNTYPQRTITILDEKVDMDTA